MTILKDWHPALLLATALFVLGIVSLDLAIGYLFGVGWGWLCLGVECLLGARQVIGLYREERGLE